MRGLKTIITAVNDGERTVLKKKFLQILPSTIVNEIIFNLFDDMVCFLRDEGDHQLKVQ